MLKYIKKKKIVFRGKMIEIIHETVVTDTKEKIVFEKGMRAPGVRLIIETPDGKFIINKEHRLNIGLDYRLPGGKVFDSLLEYNTFLSKVLNKKEIFEKAKEAAIKESMEEVGIKPTKIEFFYKSRCGGSFDWDLYYFVVKKYMEVGQKLEEHEKIEPIRVSTKKLKELALSGKMNEDRSVGVILKYLYKKEKNK